MATPATQEGSRLYRARGAAKALWSDRRPEICLSGPAGTGKSRACLEKIHACCLRWPGSRWLIVRKTRESLTESALVTFEEKVLPANSPIARGQQRRMRQAYHYGNGSEVVIGGMDKPSKVMSTEYDGIYIQEAVELFENDWESLTTRLRNGVMPFQQLIADTNPGAPSHWLRRRALAGACVMLESRHEDNPVYWDADRGEWTAAGLDYIARLERLTGVRYLRLRRGLWVAAEGIVYGGFDRALHVVPGLVRSIPKCTRRIRSIDFGYSNPFVCQWWAIDHDGRMYMYREIYRTQRTVAQHAEEILALSGDEIYEATVADHDREDRETLHQCGIPTIPAWKAISPGIQAVEGRLEKAGDGLPRIFFAEDALVSRDELLAEAKMPVCTLEEFDGYARPQAKDGKALKEDPIDVDNHGVDAMRYACAYIDALSSLPGGVAVIGGPDRHHRTPTSQPPPRPSDRPIDRRPSQGPRPPDAPPPPHRVPGQAPPMMPGRSPFPPPRRPR